MQYDEENIDRWNRGNIRFNADILFNNIPGPSTSFLLRIGILCLVFAATRDKRELLTDFLAMLILRGDYICRSLPFEHYHSKTKLL